MVSNLALFGHLFGYFKKIGQFVPNHLVTLTYCLVSISKCYHFQTELLHHINTKHLPVTLGGEASMELDNWLMVQELVEAFSFNARCPCYNTFSLRHKRRHKIS